MTSHNFFSRFFCAALITGVSSMFFVECAKRPGDMCNPIEENKSILKGDILNNAFDKSLANLQAACAGLANADLAQGCAACANISKESIEKSSRLFQKLFNSPTIEDDIKLMEILQKNAPERNNVDALIASTLRNINREIGTSGQTFEKKKFLKSLQDTVPAFRDLLGGLNKLKNFPGIQESVCAEKCEECVLGKECLICGTSGRWNRCSDIFNSAQKREVAKNFWQNELLNYVKGLTNYINDTVDCIKEETKCSIHRSRLGKDSFNSKSAQEKLQIIQDAVNAYFNKSDLLAQTTNQSDTIGEKKSNNAGRSVREKINDTRINFVKIDANGKLLPQQTPLNVQIKQFEMLITALEAGKVDMLCFTPSECNSKPYCRTGMAALFEKNVEEISDTNRLERLRLRIEQFIAQIMCGDTKEKVCTGSNGCPKNLPLEKKLSSSCTKENPCFPCKKLEDIQNGKIDDQAQAINALATCLDLKEAWLATYLCQKSDNKSIFSHPDNQNLSLATRLTNLEVRTTALEGFYYDGEYEMDFFPANVISNDRIQNLAWRILNVLNAIDKALSPTQENENLSNN